MAWAQQKRRISLAEPTRWSVHLNRSQGRMTLLVLGWFRHTGRFVSAYYLYLRYDTDRTFTGQVATIAM